MKKITLDTIKTKPELKKHFVEMVNFHIDKISDNDKIRDIFDDLEMITRNIEKDVLTYFNVSDELIESFKEQKEFNKKVIKEIDDKIGVRDNKIIRMIEETNEDIDLLIKGENKELLKEQGEYYRMFNKKSWAYIFYYLNQKQNFLNSVKYYIFSSIIGHSFSGLSPQLRNIDEKYYILDINVSGQFAYQEKNRNAYNVRRVRIDPRNNINEPEGLDGLSILTDSFMKNLGGRNFKINEELVNEMINKFSPKFLEINKNVINLQKNVKGFLYLDKNSKKCEDIIYDIRHNNTELYKLFRDFENNSSGNMYEIVRVTDFLKNKYN